jgi:nickel-dependent lactate racemase
MRQVRLLYGEGARVVAVPREKLSGIYEPRHLPAAPDLEAAVLSALENPTGGTNLAELASADKAVAILVDDVTRTVPTARILEIFLPYLERLGFELERITVICAVGAHRALTESELQGLLGRFSGRLQAINHDADDPDNLVELGTTSLGTGLKINRVFHEADVKLIVCDTEYHQFCGYGGGAKSVLPGISDRASIQTCHSRFEAPGAEPGRIEGNPVREEIEEAGEMAGVDLIVNVVLNDNKEIVRIFAGDVFEAFVAGSRIVDQMYRVTVENRVDTVIVSAGGWPKDINLYQAQKAIESAVRIVKKGGKIVLVAECREGAGSKLFHQWMTHEKDLDTIIRKIRERFVLGAHKAFQFARELLWADVFLYSSMDPELIERYYMHPLREFGQIEAIVADSQRIVILPQATATLPVLAGASA